MSNKESDKKTPVYIKDAHEITLRKPFLESNQKIQNQSDFSKKAQEIDVRKPFPDQSSPVSSEKK